MMRWALLITGTLCQVFAIAITAMRVGFAPETVVAVLGEWTVLLVIGWLGWVHAGTMVVVGWVLLVAGIACGRQTGPRIRRD